MRYYVQTKANNSYDIIRMDWPEVYQGGIRKKEDVVGKIDRFNSEVKRYAPSYKGKMVRQDDGKYVRLVDYHRLKLQYKPLDDENQTLSGQLWGAEDAFNKMRVDYNKRRSQAKRYQRSAKRRHKTMEALTAERDQLRERVGELEDTLIASWEESGKLSSAYTNYRKQLTKAKGALERIDERLAWELRSGWFSVPTKGRGVIGELKDATGEALTELRDKSYLDKRLEDPEFRKLYEQQKKLVDEGEGETCTTCNGSGEKEDCYVAPDGSPMMDIIPCPNCKRDES